jgi:hypothetical protein
MGRTIPQRMMIILSLHSIVSTSVERINAQFTNATKRTILVSLFRKASVLDHVINYTRNEVEIAQRRKNTKKAVPESRMLQEIHLPAQPVIDLLHSGHDTDIFDVFDDGKDGILWYMLMAMALMTYSLNLQQYKQIALILDHVLFT